MRLIFGIATNRGARSFITQVGANGIEEPVEMPYSFVDGEFSPDGRSIAFENCGAMGNKAFGIYVVNLVDRKITLMAPMTGKTCTCVRWAPEGERLSFVDPADRRLHIVNLASKEVSSLTNAEVELLHWWSPLGDEIVFSRSSGGNRELFITNLKGVERQLTYPKDFARAWAPTWSRDGSRIAFIENESLSSSVLYTMAPDGTDLKRLEASGYEPRWSTDGEWLLFRKGDQLMQIRKDGTGLKMTGRLKVTVPSVLPAQSSIFSSFSLN